MSDKQFINNICEKCINREICGVMQNVNTIPCNAFEYIKN